MKSSLEDRFWARVDRRSDDECWEWTGSRTSHGYGSMSVGGRNRGAHRIAYEIHYGPIPPGLVTDHLCRVRHCVNPAHMEIVTNRENVIRGTVCVPRTHCARGHRLDDDNTGTDRHGRRRCLACKKAADHARYVRSLGEDA